MEYEEKQTQKQRVLNCLRQGKKITQINLQRYLYLLGNCSSFDMSVVDAIADLGIANLPARIFGLRQDGYVIKSEDVKVKGRDGKKTHYVVYSLEEN